MRDVARFIKGLLSLADLEVRHGWLQDTLQRAQLEEVAQILDRVLEQSDAADPDARECLFTLVLWVVSAEEEGMKSELRAEADRAGLLSLSRLLRKAPRNSARSLTPGERAVPDYGTGRELTLGERRSLARRPDRRKFEALLSDPHPMVIRQLLANPKLTEEDVMRLAARRPAQAEVLRELARNPRWLRRSRVRQAILHNPGAPAEVTVPMLGLCNRAELRAVLRSTDVPIVLRATALELLDRRPPLDKPVEPPPIQ